MTPSVAQVILPSVLQRFMNDHRNVQIDLRDKDSAAVAKELRQDCADIGIARITAPPGFEGHHLFSDAFGVVCRSDLPRMQNWDTLSWADL